MIQWTVCWKHKEEYQMALWGALGVTEQQPWARGDILFILKAASGGITVSHHWERVLMASSGWRSEVRRIVLGTLGSFPQQRITRPKMSVVLRLWNTALNLGYSVPKPLDTFGYWAAEMWLGWTQMWWSIKNTPCFEDAVQNTWHILLIIWFWLHIEMIIFF